MGTTPPSRIVACGPLRRDRGRDATGSWIGSQSTLAIDDGGTPNYFDMRFYAVQSIPEPSALGLMALGACGGLILAVGRRRVARGTPLG
jgi:hypothetical protein